MNKPIERLVNCGILIGSMITVSLGIINSSVAQNVQAVIYAPPSNVRATPNGQVICRITAVTRINTYSYNKGWYRTDVCGRNGYIHESQVRFESVGQSPSFSGTCYVTNIRTGQLAVRKSPGGASIVGLNNGNTVQYLEGDMPWYYIRVISGPNPQVNGRTGWVNANYLNCD
jgi:serine/threonine-protein kinase